MKRLVFLLGIFLCPAISILAQDALRVDVDKPQKFENKRLGYEKTGEKKFGIPRRFIQNTTTHYNYYFNANERLNAVIARAKSIHRDKYTELLSFYNYSLEQTAADKQEIDSVIYKITTGILIHDLRNDWLDDLYLLMGKAYYFRNQLDTAWQTFQYINYAFAPKEKDGYDKLIGSNSSEGSNAFSIATREKRNIVKKVLSEPPGRNESFIWQIRTFLQLNELPEAAGLIETLKNDPHFPSRLHTDLNEVQAFWFYKQNMYDSAAKYLTAALSNAETGNELARWEYLIAQLYERAGRSDNAQVFYARSMRHTYDPVMEVFARLNAVKQNKDTNNNNIQRNIDELVKMGRHDKYFNYRDLIYYTAAQMELERSNEAGANKLLLKSIKYSVDNPDQRNLSFLQLGDLAYKNRDFLAAKSYYDSITAPSPLIEDPDAFNMKKAALNQLLLPYVTISRQDSLQRIAAMPDKEREAYLKKLLKQFRRARGMKEDESSQGNNINATGNNSNAPVDLFNKDEKGVWYFDNPSLKARGFTEFKSKWGTRRNVDNWRRIAAVTAFAQAQPIDTKTGDIPPIAAGSTELSYEALSGNLPLTPEKLKVSNDSIEIAFLQLGRVYQDAMENYPLAIQTYDTLLRRFPNTARKADVWFGLYYAYWKLKNQPKADYYRNLLLQQFPGSKQANAVNPNGVTVPADTLLKQQVTTGYAKVYDLFIEGDFEKAIAAKKELDAQYGNKYWTPQLSYIEAVYYIKQRNDSTAKLLLSDIIYRFKGSPMFGKAQTMLDVLNRRKEIETYLTNLQVQREGTDSLKKQTDTMAVAIHQPEIKKGTPGELPKQPEQQKLVSKSAPAKIDSLQKSGGAIVPIKPLYKFNPAEPHLVLIVLDKVDPVYVTETRNAFYRYNREKYYNKTIDINNVPLDENIKLVVMSGFDNAEVAMDYVDKAKKIAGTEIVPWLPAGKYSFYIISPSNLELLKNAKDINTYRQALNGAFPGRF